MKLEAMLVPNGSEEEGGGLFFCLLVFLQNLNDLPLDTLLQTGIMAWEYGRLIQQTKFGPNELPP